MAERRPRRQYGELPGRGGRREPDVAVRAQRLKIATWASAGGGLIGAFFGGTLGHPVLGGAAGAVGVYLFVVLVVERVGWMSSFLYAPSGASTPRKKEYSYAESLVARGAYEEARRAYELEILEDPREPEPYLRLARLFRDELDRPEEAVRWFRRALREADLSPGQEIRALREVAEVYLHRTGEPRKAAPELARLAERFPDTMDGQWARQELREVKARIRAEEE